MTAHTLLIAPIGLLPVLLYLALLLQLDSYKLVSLGEILEALVAGAFLAGVAYFVNGRAISALHYSLHTYSNFVAPFAEESLKAAFMLVMFARNRLGFMIDAAIVGFGVGAGFAVAENIYYLTLYPQPPLGVFVIRGLGTALMHGGATCIFGVMAQSLTERHSDPNPLYYLPGLAAAIALHGLYNYFQSTPLLATVVMLVALPLALLLVFNKSEHRIHTWLLADYESHEHLLAEIRAGRFAQSAAGRFMLDIERKFGSSVAADVLAYIQLHTELVMRAEKDSLAHEKGVTVHEGRDVREMFAQLHALEKKIGRTAMLAVWPHLHFSRQELWELHALEGQAAHS
jgi:RsiW-degrading membrane proteinase PrsW (M82 family)